MAKVPVTGRLSDFTDTPIPTGQAVMQAIPVAEGLSSAGLHAARPEPVALAADGTWTVQLVPSTQTRVRYVIKATWTADGVVSTHYWDHGKPIWIPEGGGPIHALAGARQGDSALLVAVVPGAPDPDLADQYQYDPQTGTLYERRA